MLELEKSGDLEFIIGSMFFYRMMGAKDLYDELNKKELRRMF